MVFLMGNQNYSCKHGVGQVFMYMLNINWYKLNFQGFFFLSIFKLHVLINTDEQFLIIFASHMVSNMVFLSSDLYVIRKHGTVFCFHNKAN